MYKDENTTKLAEAYPVNNPTVWVQGNMTNAADAVDAGLVRAGKLYPYNQNPGIFHCPSDPGVTIDGARVANVRSYSMNSFMGGRPAGVGVIPPTATAYVPFFTRDSELARPANLFVLLDEDERSITDGFFITDPAARVWYNFPAVTAGRHAFSSSLVFADGHGEIWRFKDARTALVREHETDQIGNTDLVRFGQAATVAQ